MHITVVNDWHFKKNGNIKEGLAAADELVENFKANEPDVQLSLWLRAQEQPLRFFHITVFDDYEAFQKIRETKAIQRFVERLYPEIDQTSHTAPECDVVLSSGGKIPEVKKGNTKSVTVVNDWNFREDGDIHEGLAAAAEYVDWFKANKPEVQLSLWARDRTNPLRFFHIVTFVYPEAAVEGRQWEGTVRFADRLYPEIDENSVKQPLCDVVLSSGGHLEAVPLRL